MKIPRSILSCVPALLLVPLTAFAQSQDRTTVVDTASHTADSGLSSGVIEDLGQPQETSPYAPKFGLNAGTQLQFISNALQQGKNGSADFLFVPTLNVTALQPLPAGFSLDAIIRLDSVIYTRYSSLNFWGPSGAAHLNWQYKSWLPVVYFGTEPYDYQGFNGTNITAASTITTGIAQSFSLGHDGRTQLTLAYKFSEYYAHPAIDDRSANLATVTLNHNFTSTLSAQAFYSYQYSYYNNALQTVDTHRFPFVYNNYYRQESRNIAGINLIKRFNKNLTATLSGAWIGNNSTAAGFSYQNIVVSLGVNWQFF
jgi:hypothetical protein